MISKKWLGMWLVAFVTFFGMAASQAWADTVYAWGSNNYGQLGDGTTTNRNSPVAVTGLSSNVTAVAAGCGHSFAIQNGGVWAWGLNNYGQLGDGTTINQSSPIALTGAMSSGVTTIVGGGYHSLALKAGGVWAWGNNDTGQLGNDGAGQSEGNPIALGWSMNWSVTAIAAGNYHSLALKNGGVWAWGANLDGQLGYDSLGLSFPIPNALTEPMSSGVTAIAGGYGHSLALKNGGVWAWGNSNSTPTVFAGAMSSGVTAIAAGGYHSLALKNGAVWAWGYNWYGQLGDGTTTDRYSPIQVDPTHLRDIVAIAAGAGSSYALSADGSLWVWGDNSYGQLGLGTTSGQYYTPQRLLPPDGYSYTSIAAGSSSNHVLATVARVSTGCTGHPADFNGDCMVDDADINFLLSCFTGPEGSVSGKCQISDINKDGVVDMVDFAILQRCLAPESSLLNPNCAN